MHQFLDPKDDLLEDISQNNGVLIPAPLNDPLLFLRTPAFCHSRPSVLHPIEEGLEGRPGKARFFSFCFGAARAQRFLIAAAYSFRMRRFRSEDKAESKTYSLILKMCGAQLKDNVGLSIEGPNLQSLPWKQGTFVEAKGSGSRDCIMDKAVGAAYFVQVAAPLSMRAVCAMHQLPCFLQV